MSKRAKRRLVRALYVLSVIVIVLLSMALAYFALFLARGFAAFLWPTVACVVGIWIAGAYIDAVDAVDRRHRG